MDRDRGPAPKVNLRNARKRTTAAEMMSSLQEEYEARGKPSANRVQPVHAHNDTHPKLKKQLQKRRSTSEVLDVKQPNTARGTNRTCRRQPTRRRSSHRRPKTITRVTKKRVRKHCGCEKCLPKHGTKKAMSQWSQISTNAIVVNKGIGTEVFKSSAGKELDKKASGSSQVSKKHSNMGIDTPVSRRPSVSSYNSYLSMEHEPMG